MAQVVLHTSEFEGEVHGLVSRATNFRPALKEFGNVMIRSVTRNFTEQGRPVHWQPDKIATLIARYRRGNRERTNKRQLFKGLKGAQGGAFQSAVNAVSAGTVLTAERGSTFTQGAARALANAKILMDTGSLRASINFDVSNMQVRIGTNLKYAATQQFGRGAIPARPYLVIQAEDEAEFKRLLLAHLAGEL